MNRLPAGVAIRLHGHPADVAAALETLRAVFPDTAVSRPYRDRAGGRVRIYLTTRPTDHDRTRP